MASRALFAGAGSRPRSNNLVEFKAGKMTLKGKMCHADKRKGLLYVYESDDSLMHFCWKDRTTGEVEDDLLIFPDDVIFKHVPQCKTGRVYVLKFNNSSRKFIFWMQEPKGDKDEELCKKVNRCLNSPAGTSSRHSGGGGQAGGPGGMTGLPSELSSLGEGDLQNILGGMSQQQLIQLLGGMGGGLGGLGGLSGLTPPAGGTRGGARGASLSQMSEEESPLRVQSSPGPRAGGSGASSGGLSDSAETPSSRRPVTAAAATTDTKQDEEAAPSPLGTSTTPATAGGGGPMAPIQLSDLQSILQTMNVPGASSGTPGPTAGESAAGAVGQSMDLMKTLGSSEVMIPILANKDVQNRLTPFLPTGEILPSSEEELRRTFSSNQYHQALRSFGEALQSGQLGPLLNQFGLSIEAVEAANRGDVEAFARAVQESEAADEQKVEKMEADDPE